MKWPFVWRHRHEAMIAERDQICGAAQELHEFLHKTVGQGVEIKGDDIHAEAVSSRLHSLYLALRANPPQPEPSSDALAKARRRA